MSILDSFRLDDQVIVITGGAGIYGTRFSTALAEAGAHVVLTSRQLGTARSAAAALTDQGHRASGYALDQSDPDSIKTLTDTLDADFGRVDVLVNNAVYRAGSGLFQTTADEWAATSATNSRGLFLLTQSVAKIMVRERAGSVINIGSIYGLVAPDFAIYEESEYVSPVFYSYDKAGMVGFTRYLAAALGEYGVRANCLCPGGYNPTNESTPFSERYSSRVPLRRMATGDDASGALVFLASAASSYITGAVLPVDGGWTAH